MSVHFYFSAVSEQPAVVREARKSKVVRCKHKDCDKILTQPYAQRRGECLECIQKRLHDGKSQKFFYTWRRRETRRRALELERELAA